MADDWHFHAVFYRWAFAGEVGFGHGGARLPLYFIRDRVFLRWLSRADFDGEKYRQRQSIRREFPHDGGIHRRDRDRRNERERARHAALSAW